MVQGVVHHWRSGAFNALVAVLQSAHFCKGLFALSALELVELSCALLSAVPWCWGGQYRSFSCWCGCWCCGWRLCARFCFRFQFLFVWTRVRTGDASPEFRNVYSRFAPAAVVRHGHVQVTCKITKILDAIWVSEKTSFALFAAQDGVAWVLAFILNQWFGRCIWIWDARAAFLLGVLLARLLLGAGTLEVAPAVSNRVEHA